jgi:hypothetical protein
MKTGEIIGSNCGMVVFENSSFVANNDKDSSIIRTRIDMPTSARHDIGFSSSIEVHPPREQIKQI